jgi:hypothetical protein
MNKKLLTSGTQTSKNPEKSNFCFGVFPSSEPNPDPTQDHSPKIIKKTFALNHQPPNIFANSINFKDITQKNLEENEVKITKSVEFKKPVNSNFEMDFKKPSNQNQDVTSLMPNKKPEKCEKPTNAEDGLPNHEPPKCSFKVNGIVKAYAANTN